MFNAEARILTVNRWMAIALSTSIGIMLVGCGSYSALDQTTSESSDPPESTSPSSQDSSQSSQSERSPILDNPVPEEPLPIANVEGDYPRTSHRRWVVVDPDPAGLNCRWSEDFPAEWYSPATLYPRMNVDEWAVVRQFPTGAELLSNITPAGFAIMYDEDRAPWLKVSIGDQDEICLVRANAAFVEPIP